MSRRPAAATAAADGPVVDGIVDGGIHHRQAGVSEVAMDVGFSEVGEQPAPTTTITTVAVQAGKAKIVLAILKVRPPVIPVLSRPVANGGRVDGFHPTPLVSQNQEELLENNQKLHYQMRFSRLQYVKMPLRPGLCSVAHRKQRSPRSKGAGSGMAGMAAAIPIQNLVWRRHTNQKYSGELV